MQTIVLEGNEVLVASFEDVLAYVRTQNKGQAIQETYNIMHTFVTKTNGVTAIHLGCRQKYRVCCCEAQIIPEKQPLAYRIRSRNISRVTGELREELYGLLQEWVVPVLQLEAVTLRDITAHLYRYKQKVLDVVKALGEAAPA